MESNKDLDREEILKRIREIGSQINSLHRDLKSFQDKLSALGKKAAAEGLPRLEYAIRDAEVRASQGGQAMVKAYLTLNQLLARKPALEKNEEMTA